MSNEKTPEDRLFTHFYCDRRPPLKDSEKFGMRIGVFCDGLTLNYQHKFRKWLEMEAGLPTLGFLDFDI